MHMINMNSGRIAKKMTGIKKAAMALPVEK